MNMNLQSAVTSHSQGLHGYMGYDATLPPQLGLPWIRSFVALADGEPAGFVMCSLEDAAVGEIDLIAIAVAEPWQSRGIGRRLLERAEEETRRLATEGPAILRLTVSEDNLRARNCKKATLPKDQQFVQLINSFRQEPAWLALSFGARCLYIELKALYNT